MNKLLCALSMALMLSAIPSASFAQAKVSKKNMVVKEWKTDAGSSVRYLDHQTTYNSDGKKVEEVEYGTSGQKWKKRYEYAANGKVAKEMVYNERNKLVTYKKIEYNAYGHRKTQSTYNAKGKLLSVKTYEYITQQ